MNYACRLVRFEPNGDRLLTLHFYGTMDKIPGGWTVVTRLPNRVLH